MVLISDDRAWLRSKDLRFSLAGYSFGGGGGGGEEGGGSGLGWRLFSGWVLVRRDELSISIFSDNGHCFVELVEAVDALSLFRDPDCAE